MTFPSQNQLELLEAILRRNPDLQPVPVTSVMGDHGPDILSVGITNDALDFFSASAESIVRVHFDQMAVVRITEDSGERYLVSVSVKDGKDPPTVVIHDEISLIVVYAALSRNRITCQFDFTPDRLSIGAQKFDQRGLAI